MEILKFYDCKIYNDTLENKYQLLLTFHKYQPDHTIKAWVIQEEINGLSEGNSYFFYKLEQLAIYEIDGFLNYHFELCENKKDFLAYTKFILQTSLDVKNLKKKFETPYENSKGEKISGYTMNPVNKLKAIACLEWIEKKNNLIEVNNQPPPQKETELVNSFDYLSPEKYFYPDKIESFKQIEKKMLQGDFFEANNWSYTHPKYELAGLIHILYNSQYLKKQLQGKNVSNSLLAYRRFFEQRYNTKIAKEFQPKRIEIKLKLAKIAFEFIIPELNTL